MASTIEISFTIAGDVSDFDVLAETALSSSLTEVLSCFEPDCFLTLVIYGGSIHVAATLVIPETNTGSPSASFLTAVSAAASLTQSSSAFGSALGVSVTNVVPPVIQESVTVPLVVAPPPPMLPLAPAPHTPSPSTGQWAPPAELRVSASGQHGVYPHFLDETSFVELHPSAQASSLTVEAFLHPDGGLINEIGVGGQGRLPGFSDQQENRPVHSHSILVQTPQLYVNLNVFVVLVQCYDEYGNSDVFTTTLTVRALIVGGQALTLSSFTWTGTGRTRRYSFSIPSSWFDVADSLGSSATVSTSLPGHDTQSSIFTVYGTPTWFASRRSVAGMAGYMTSDQAGGTPAAAMRTGDIFYLQLYAHTGSSALGSFEARLVVDPTVCEVIPASGVFSPSFTGDVQGQLTGTYSTELLRQNQDPGDESSFFIKYTRLGALSPLSSMHGHLGWIRLRMVSNGVCLTSATITAFYKADSTSNIAGVDAGDSISLFGNTLVVRARYIMSALRLTNMIVSTFHQMLPAAHAVVQRCSCRCARRVGN